MTNSTLTTTPAQHGTFTLRRNYKASAERLYQAWTDIEMKARWFVGPDSWKLLERSLDLRVGGTEILRGRTDTGLETLYAARYYAIVPNEQLVYVYDMHLGGKHHSLTVATVEIAPSGTGSSLVFTEQVVFLDGTTSESGIKSRQHGVGSHLDRIALCF